MPDMDDLDLTLEERETLKSCADPDAIVSNQYKWDQELQREVLGLLLNDRFFTLQADGLIKPEYFVSETHQLVAGIIFKHFAKYKTLPNRTQLFQEIKDKLVNAPPESKVFIFGELNTVYEYYLPGAETREYYLDKITNFAKGMAMRRAFSQCLEEYKRAPEEDETFAKIELLIRKALNTERNIDLGLDYFQTFEERYARMEEKIRTGDYFVTGFKEIDDAFKWGGLDRGEIGSVVGLSGTGKSVFLVNAAMANLHRGKKVLYISLEIDTDRCAERFDAQFANPEPFGDAHTGVTNKNLYEKKESVFAALREYVAEKDDRRLLVVKQFPGASLDTAALRAYYSQVKMLGFEPELVIVDYIGQMKDLPNMPTYESREKLVDQLRAFAVEERVCVMTAMQPDGRSREVVKLGGVIDDENLADSKGQIRGLDACWSINQ